jgi:hypothetical protein
MCSDISLGVAKYVGSIIANPYGSDHTTINSASKQVILGAE